MKIWHIIGLFGGAAAATLGWAATHSVFAHILAVLLWVAFAGATITEIGARR